MQLVSNVLLFVGEQWVRSEQTRLRLDSWSAETALRLGGFRRGPSAAFLAGFSFVPTKVCNLLPPCLEWDSRVAFRIAEELIRREDWRVGVVVGARAVRAFLGGRFVWAKPYPVGSDKTIIPCPQPRCPAWDDSDLKVRIETSVLDAISRSQPC